MADTKPVLRSSLRRHLSRRAAGKPMPLKSTPGKGTARMLLGANNPGPRHRLCIRKQKPRDAVRFIPGPILSLFLPFASTCEDLCLRQSKGI